MVHTYQVNHDIANYIVRFNVALNQCSNVTDIKDNLWAEVAVQEINCQPSYLRGYQLVTNRPESILKHGGIFGHAIKVNIKRKKPFFNFAQKGCFLTKLQTHQGLPEGLTDSH